jgi:hypothetical protein
MKGRRRVSPLLKGARGILKRGSENTLFPFALMEILKSLLRT